jgi:ATP-dependent helicase/nuclease subunit B
MLRLILGRAGTGKTARVMNEIKEEGQNGRKKLILLVPEQFSHDAERQLCRFCGDSLSLYGESVTFTRLASRVIAETGGKQGEILDEGALILAMWRALELSRPRLRLYGAGDARAEFLERLLLTAKELKGENITPRELWEAAGSASALSDKLWDLSVIFGAYDEMFTEWLDPSDILTLLARRVPASEELEGARVYIDGFSDFTAQETEVIAQFLRKGLDITVSLTCDGLRGDGEEFELPRRTALTLIRVAWYVGCPYETKELTRYASRRDPALRFLESALFAPDNVSYGADTGGAVSLLGGLSPYSECELAAAQTMKLVRSGYRWRDISVVSREAQTYIPLCENVFEKYGIPVFSGGRTDILRMSPVALAVSALEIAAGNWDYAKVFKYLKTGFAGITHEECCELENYVLRWKIRGGAWARKKPWILPVKGETRDAADETADADLARIDALRRRVHAPLGKLGRELAGEEKCQGKLDALIAFLRDIGLPEALDAKADALTALGQARRASEYSRLWTMIERVCRQFAAILGDFEADARLFARLFELYVSRCDMGAIPQSLDRVMLGDMAKGRRRDVKCLIVLGASDRKLPNISGAGGILSDAERSELSGAGLRLRDTARSRVSREMNLVYSSLALPSERLVLTCPSAGGERPSRIALRISNMFELPIKTPEISERLGETAGPCLELAAMAEEMPDDAVARAARLCAQDGTLGDDVANLFVAQWRGEDRSVLSRGAVESLYGSVLRLSATRVDRFNSCKFAFFMDSGLHAGIRGGSELDAPESGAFLHYVLENVARDVMDLGGFDKITESDCRELTSKYAGEYSSGRLRGFDDRAGRYRYLYQRLAAEAENIVWDMADELRRSDFRPTAFEYKFRSNMDLDGKKLTVSGLIDRIDIWRDGARNYVRVVDYKTGVKGFDLTDVLSGRGAQMLIYLSALRAQSDPVPAAVPAGVLYAPAKEYILDAPRRASDSEIERGRAAKLRRSGLILNLPGVIEAMETGVDKTYLPVKRNAAGDYSGDGLVSEQRLVLLLDYVDAMLARAALDIMSGDVSADPFYRGENTNACNYCEYRIACHFGESVGDARRYQPKIGDGEFWGILEAGV